MNGCKYCTEDRDGYVPFLPRTGKGRASIHDGMGGPHILISGPNRMQMDIPIDFCPKCGRKLKAEEGAS